MDHPTETIQAMEKFWRKERIFTEFPNIKNAIPVIF